MTSNDHVPSVIPDRRRGTRTRLGRVVRAMAGRHQGVLIDLSLHGARLRHEGALRRGSTVRLSFDLEKDHFVAAAEILASRIITLGGRDGEAAVFESRMRFALMSEDAHDTLARILTALNRDELRTWVGNLHGSPDSPSLHGASRAAAGFIRCRYVRRQWEKKWTRDASQPSDGFTLPAATERAELDGLCLAWKDMNDEARDLLRLTANAVAEYSATG